MRGVILAGGEGTRLLPLTKVTNKHLLPVGEKPMIQHAVEKLVQSGIVEILIVTGGEHIGDMAEFLGGGSNFGCEFTYRVQEEAGGIAHALSLAEGFVNQGEKMCVVLGDNIFEDPLSDYICGHYSAKVLLKKVEDPWRFGVAVFQGGQVANIEEKPRHPKTPFAVTGIYLYDHTVFPIIRGLEKSERGELEITDVNNVYAERGELDCAVLEGWWTDAGTHSSYKKANQLV